MGDAGGLTVAVQEDGERRLVSVAGELDAERCATLQATLDPLAAEGREISVDLTAVNFMDSSGLRCLLMAREEAIRSLGSVVVVACSDHVRRLLEISGTWPALTGFYAEH